MTANPTLRTLDFTDVAGRLKSAGGRIRRFATVIHCDYMSSGFSDSLLYRVTVQVGDHTYLCVDAHTLAFDWFGVRASLHVNFESTLCAAWMFSDASMPPINTEQPLCIRCLVQCLDGSCEHKDIEIQQIPFGKLIDAVVAWVRNELPENARRGLQPPA